MGLVIRSEGSMGFLPVKVSGRQLAREDSPFPTRKHPGFGGGTVKMEPFFRVNCRLIGVGYGGWLKWSPVQG